MDIIFGNDIYNMISSFFTDFNDLIILCHVCRSMRYHKYKHNSYYVKVIFIDKRIIPILDINLKEIHCIKPYEITRNHIEQYTNLKCISFNGGIFDKIVKNILSKSSIKVLSVNNLRIDTLPILESISSLEWINCIPKNCNFKQSYKNIKALWLSNLGFEISDIYFSYFPNLEYLYVDTNDIIDGGIYLSKLVNLIYLNYENMRIRQDDLIKLTKLEYLNADFEYNDNLQMNSLKYLVTCNIDYQYTRIFPNILYIIYNGDITPTDIFIPWYHKENKKIGDFYYKIFFNKQSNYFLI